MEVSLPLLSTPTEPVIELAGINMSLRSDLLDPTLDSAEASNGKYRFEICGVPVDLRVLGVGIDRFFSGGESLAEVWGEAVEID